MKIQTPLALLAGAIILLSSWAQAAPVSTPLAVQGKAALPIVVSATASDAVKAHAATLAEYLGKISGAKFEIKTGDGQSGIALGTVAEYSALPAAQAFGEIDATSREDYILRSHPRGVLLLGASDLAARHAVWDLLHRVGYRHFFPSQSWEIVPGTPSLSIAVDEREHPDYLARRLWYGFGSWKENMQDKAAWDLHNRMATSLDIKSGHAYDTIYKANKAEFDKHPEYIVSKHPVKFCVSNPGLRKLAVEHALRYFEANPDADSISMEPSDGGGWDSEGSCKDGEVYKTVTDRVIALANEVAEAVNKRYKNKYVGIYSYYQHSPPPSIKVHPNVAVQIAAGYIQGGWTMDGLLDGWRQQGAKLIGVREYYSVFSTHWDRPAGPVASSTARIKTTTPHYYEKGARLMSAESSESWGPAGLSYYLASRLLWDTKEDPDAIVEDFLEKSFGPAQGEMREFYRLIDRANQPIFTRDLIGRMYRHLDAARKMTSDAGIRARLDELALWTRYCEMLWEWQNVAKDKKALGEEMLKFTYRWHRSGMMHTYVLWRHSFKLAGGRINLKRDGHPYPKETHFNSPRDKNPWMSDEPIPAAEIENFVRAGIANNPVAEFTPVSYSRDLVPATKLNLTSPAPGGFDYTRMTQNFYVWIDKAPATIKLEVLGGQIATRGNTTISLYAMKDGKEDGAPETDDADEEEADADNEQAAALPADYDGTAPVIKDHAVDTVDVPNDRQPHVVEIKARESGLHRLRVVDRGKGASVKWPRGLPVVIESSKAVQTLLRGRNLVMYFYVPRGTTVIGGFATSRPTLIDSSGKAVATLAAGPEMFSVPVPPGEDGKLWRIDRAAKVLLMTVPPYLARSADEMLLPREVVEKDAR